MYNCIKTIHKITPYKLFNTKFNIGLNAFLTRAQPFHVKVGVGGEGVGILRATRFFPLDTVRDNWLVRKEEFAHGNIVNSRDPGLVPWGEFSATKRSLYYESHLNYSICALTRLYENKYVKLAKDFEAEEGIAKVQIHNKQIVGNTVGYADCLLYLEKKIEQVTESNRY